MRSFRKKILFGYGVTLILVVVVLLVVDALLNALHEIYQKLPISQGRNIKGYVQVVKIIVYFAAVIMIIHKYFFHGAIRYELAGL